MFLFHFYGWAALVGLDLLTTEPSASHTHTHTLGRNPLDD